MALTVLIIEDDPITSQDLYELMRDQGFEVLEPVFSVEQARQSISKHNPEVLLVDVNLEGKESGIDLVRELNGEKPVVYLTGNSDSATVKEAMATRPSAYLTKPFSEPDVIIAIELAFQNHTASKVSDQEIFLRDADRYRKVLAGEILYFEAEGSYTRVVLSDQTIVQSKNLSHFEKILKEQFVRVHKSFLVNMKKVDAIGKGLISIAHNDIPIGRSYKAVVDELFSLRK